MRKIESKNVTSAKQLLSEIHLHNMICRYQDINLKNRRKASTPDVGVFWVDLDTGKVYSDKTKLKDAVDMGTHKIHPLGHYEVWKQIVKENPKWRGVEYEDVPRGRVVYLKDPKKPKFVVYAAEQCNSGKIKNAIAGEFDLPTGHYEFDFTDEHYEIF